MIRFTRPNNKQIIINPGYVAAVFETDNPSYTEIQLCHGPEEGNVVVVGTFQDVTARLMRKIRIELETPDKVKLTIDPTQVSHVMRQFDGQTLIKLKDGPLIKVDGFYEDVLSSFDQYLMGTV